MTLTMERDRTHIDSHSVTDSEGAGKTTTNRPRRTRVDVGSIRQKPRDVQLLTWLAQMYGAPMDLLAEALGVSVSAVYQTVQRWKKAGWVQSGRVDAGPAWVWPNPAIAKAYLDAEREVTAWRPSLGRVAHLRATAAVRLHLTGLAVDEWTSERVMGLGTGFRRQGDRIGHLLDGVAISEGRSTAIEVELHAKPLTTYYDPQREVGLLTEIAEAAKNAKSGEVAYYAPRSVRLVLERVITEYLRRWGNQPGALRWQVYPLEEVPGWIPPEKP